MKKGTFYGRKYAKAENGDATSIIEAFEMEGFVDGDIGISHNNRDWQATHIPTGLLICESCRTKDIALFKAQDNLSQDWVQDKIENHLASREQEQFLKAVNKLKGVEE